jgi:hypothetical protein
MGLLLVQGPNYPVLLHQISQLSHLANLQKLLVLQIVVKKMALMMKAAKELQIAMEKMGQKFLQRRRKNPRSQKVSCPELERNFFQYLTFPSSH